jgi:hypothetical protein
MANKPQATITLNEARALYDAAQDDIQARWRKGASWEQAARQVAAELPQDHAIAILRYLVGLGHVAGVDVRLANNLATRLNVRLIWARREILTDTTQTEALP